MLTKGGFKNGTILRTSYVNGPQTNLAGKKFAGPFLLQFLALLQRRAAMEEENASKRMNPLPSVALSQ